MTPAERIDAFAARGIMLYLSPIGVLRAACDPGSAALLVAARTALRHHKPEIVATLQRWERDRTLRPRHEETQDAPSEETTAA